MVARSDKTIFMKIGRNDPCPCGSCKKYKKCHYLIDSIQPIIPPHILEEMGKPEPISQNGRLVGRPVIATHFKDKRIVAVGSRLYHNLPPEITFHEFIIIFLKDIVGTSWGLAENKKPKEDQHLIAQWLAEMGDLFRSSDNVVQERVKGDIKSVEPTGNVQSLLALAYDIYSIYHSSEIPNDLLERLKNPDQFQGAKYELSVAGIFARAGFKIDWIPKSKEKTCEFIATNRITKEKIIVEAKSRHRKGVLGRQGEREDLNSMRSQVGKLFNDALKKNTNKLPFMIFIDINLPLTEGNNDLKKRWVKDIKNMLSQHPMGTEKNPEPFTALFITNFSWHYEKHVTALSKGENVVIVPLFSTERLNDNNTFNLLHQATLQYGAVPPLFPDDNVT